VTGRETAAGIAGREAEQFARRYLEAQGLHFVSANYLCRRGEIDLVMRDNRTLVFVEVRYRRGSGFGGGVESIDHRKRRRLLAAAEHYLQAHPRARRAPCRIDVVALAPAAEGYAADWIPNAVEAESSF